MSLSVIAKMWEQSKCLLMNEWIKKMWYVYIYIHICIYVCICIHALLPSHELSLPWSLLFFKLYAFCVWLLWVFIAVHGLSLVGASEGYSLVVCGLLAAVASLVLERGVWSAWAQ